VAIFFEHYRAGLTINEEIFFYDCEIANLIEPEPGYQSCGGWKDFAGMGISIIGCYSNKYGYRVFSGKELKEFEYLYNQHHICVGFNSKSFDDQLLRANGVEITTDYDLLEEVRIASGQPAEFTPGVTRWGYSLNNLAQANLSFYKSGDGALASMLWQQGKLGELIHYCLTDVKILVNLYARKHSLVDPTNNQTLNLPRMPFDTAQTLI
jgi:hypothetical protein